MEEKELWKRKLIVHTQDRASPSIWEKELWNKSQYYSEAIMVKLNISHSLCFHLESKQFSCLNDVTLQLNMVKLTA